MLRTVVLLSILTGILLAIGGILGGLWGLTIALIFALVINFISYWYSDRIVLKIYKAKETDNEKLLNIVRKLSYEANMPTPKLYIIPSDVPNALATGRNSKNSVVAITKGLTKMEDNEIAGVIAHEIGHIRNRDVLVGTATAIVAGAISYLAQIGYWSLFFGGDERGEANIIGLVLIIIFAPLAALLIRLAISRTREYKADYSAVLISKDPSGLESALRKISRFTKENPIRGNSATSHMWFVNPFKGDWFSNMFSTHPPVEKRIERISAMRQEYK